MFKRLKKCSLRVKFLLVLVLAAAGAWLLFQGTHRLGTAGIDWYIRSTDYQAREDRQAAESFQSYITENRLSSGDMDQLRAWNRNHPSVYCAVISGKHVTYDTYDIYASLLEEESDSGQDSLSAASGETEETGEEAARYVSELYADSASIFPVTFSDGVKNVFLQSSSEDRFYQIADGIEIALSLFLFVLILLIFVGRLISRIHSLQGEVSVLEGGGMEQPITVRGNDELSDLAGDIEQMRRSLNASFSRITQLSAQNSQMVSRMSHDFRTPLTVILLYSDLASQEPDLSEKTTFYLDKIHDKALQLKSMSDQLFEQSRTSTQLAQAGFPSGEHTFSEMTVRYAFEEPLSDMIQYLSSQGYEIACEPVWPSANIQVSTEYLNRIFDNIASNILRYARKDTPIRLEILSGEHSVIIREENMINPDPDAAGTHVGLHNIEAMMEEMGGRCTWQEDGNRFRIQLSFPAR